MSLLKYHYLIQSKKPTKKNDSLKPIFQFLDTKNAVLQKYGSFEMAEQAIRELLVELEKS